MIFCSIFPTNNSEFNLLKEAMNKLLLSDGAISFEYENSKALGFGIRCGFLGLLHMDVVIERISREYNIETFVSAPSVKYEVYLTNGSTILINNPNDLPEVTKIKEIREPFVELTIISSEEYIGSIIELAKRNRGEYIKMESINNKRLKVIFNIPLSEIITNFFDKLKSVSKGYATMDYTLTDYKKNDLVKVDILLNGDKVDAFSFICFRGNAEEKGRKIVDKIKEFVPRQLFEVPVQAAIGGKIIARETIKAFRKDVLAKCYGGDVTRQMKLLEKQKEGKKKLKMIGRVNVPNDIFVKILKD